MFDTVSEVFELCERKHEADVEEELRWYGVAIITWLVQYHEVCGGQYPLPEGRRPSFSLDKFAGTILRS